MKCEKAAPGTLCVRGPITIGENKKESGYADHMGTDTEI